MAELFYEIKRKISEIHLIDVSHSTQSKNTTIQCKSMHCFLMAIITNYSQHRELEEDKKPGLESHTWKTEIQGLWIWGQSELHGESLSPKRYKLNKY